MLSISNLHVSVGDKPILKGLTLDVPVGGSVMLPKVSLEGSVG
jgi:Fe-S cluster assembly ATPase SufC